MSDLQALLPHAKKGIFKIKIYIYRNKMEKKYTNNLYKILLN